MPTPFGAWPSPLSAKVLASGAVRLAGVAQRGDEIWWSELRPAEAGRIVLVCRTGSATAVDRLASPWSARTQVHEYGGSAWWLGATSVYFANWDDQRLYRLAPDATGGSAESESPLTPEPPAPRAWRYADGREHPDSTWLVCVRERHGDAPEAINELVAIPLAAGAGLVELRPLATGEPPADFVAAPRFSPDGRWLSWIRWDHPRMPWDGTELCVAPVLDGPEPGSVMLGEVQVVAGSDRESIVGPDWTSDGRLVFSTDRFGWWNLHAWAPGAANGTVETLTTLDDAEIGGPQWVFGTQRWAELPAGHLAAAVTRDATDELVVVDPDGELAPVGTAHVAIADLATTDRGTILVHGASPTELPSLAEFNADGSVVAEHRPPDDLGIDPAWYSTATPVAYSANDRGRDVHAFFYPPVGPGLTGAPGDKPPLVVMGHGGPTSHSTPALNLAVQYWTSRGFAVANVNYGGSTGFGRGYRRLLDGAWGVIDVDDCATVASRLAADGLVDPDRLAIRGGSAGGFTTLMALATSDVFSAGTSLYGVTDLAALARDTHKFESRYLDGLIGPYPDRLDLYQDRSPIHHTDGLSCPVLVLQGLEDEVVPPNQAEAIVAAVAAKGIPHAYVAFEGEQHGFRQAGNIIRAFELELWFYGRVFGFTPADPIVAPATAVGL